MNSEAPASRLASGRAHWSGRVRQLRWLPPLQRREFWAVQVLVLLIAALHALVEAQHVLDERSPIYLVPTSLYLIPIVYAAVNFGLRGSLLTAVWSSLLVVPNVVLLHEGLERSGEIIQVAWITFAAVFVGSRVDRERGARLEAEQREHDLRASERRYRSIVESVGEPIILLDGERRVMEINQAAATMLGRDVDDVRGQPLSGRGGDEIVRALASSDTGADSRQRLRLGEPARWYGPISMESVDADGSPMTQLLLIDMTASYERERGLEGVTRHTLAAREEERRRISRELHDGPLQALILLWRELDTIAMEVDGRQRDELLEARATAEAVASELRRFSRELRPSVLDDLGVVAAIRSEAESLERREGIATTVVVHGAARRLHPELEIAFLRITQEALQNVARHAGATMVAISVDFDRRVTRLRISDNGIGLGPIPTTSELLKSDRLGVIGMRERAIMAGATLELSASPSGGLEVQVEAVVVEPPKC